jgi:Fur family transcriptional regulator, ferric uptake regulator
MRSRVKPSTSKAESDGRVDEVLELLRESGGRVTTSRRILLRCLFEESPHRTAEELAAEVQRVAPDVHISTIYRNLDELERLGIIVHAHLGHGPATYHLSSDTHGHLVCESCAFTYEAPEDLFEELAATAFRDFHFVIDPRHFAVLGRCKGCVEADAT